MSLFYGSKPHVSLFLKIFFYSVVDELDIPYVPLFTMFLNDCGQRSIQLPKFMPTVSQPYIVI